MTPHASPARSHPSLLHLLVLPLLAITHFADLATASNPHSGEAVDANHEFADDPIIALTEPTLRRTVRDHPHVLLVFFDSKDQHAHAFLREVRNLEADVTKLGVIVANVDGHQIGDRVRQEFRAIGNLPTVTLARNGEFRPYLGEPTSRDDLLAFLRRRLGLSVSFLPSYSAAAAAQVAMLLADAPAVAVAYVESKESLMARAFTEASRDLDGLEFVLTSHPSVAAAFGLTARQTLQVAVWRRHAGEGEEATVEYDGPLSDPPSLSSFLSAHQLPLVLTWHEGTSQAIADSQIKKQVLFISPPTLFSLHLPVFRAVAAEFRGKALFLHLDSSSPDLEQPLEFLGVKTNATAIRGVVTEEDGYPTERKYRMPGAFTRGNLKSFVDRFVTGALKPYFLSDPPPGKPSGPVHVVVGSTFKQIVLDRTKDVMIRIDLPSCPECVGTDATLTRLARNFARVPSVVVAKMQMGTNEYPGLDISAFPTFLFYPANKKHRPIEPDGITLGALATLIEKHANVPILVPLSEEDDMDIEDAEEEMRRDEEVVEDDEDGHEFRRAGHDEL